MLRLRPLDLGYEMASSKPDACWRGIMGRGETMYFHFGTRKIIEAVATLLRSDPCRRMGALRLLKLLYIADRESFREVGRPIVGTKPVAMDFGPIHSDVYDLVKGSHWDEETWAEFIRKDGINVELTKDPGVLTLSRYEIDKLTETAERYRDVSDYDLVGVTHAFPEWSKNYRKKTSMPIPMSDILEAVGRADEEDDILGDAKHVRAFNMLFGMTS